jgi:hypothetical protein
VKGIKPFISGLTFARGNNQPFRSNAIAFLSSEFLKLVEDYIHVVLV